MHLAAVCLFLCALINTSLVALVSAHTDILHTLPHVDATSLQAYFIQSRIGLAVFYTTWCSHCRNMIQSIAKVNTRLRSTTNSSDISQIAMVNMGLEENSGLLKTLPIYGYPSVLLFKDGEFSEGYSGSRTEK
jgi:thiol-disulfide isomerase/thioredoxin